MKNFILITLIMFFLFPSSFSQNEIGKLDDMSRISLKPVIPPQAERIPAYAKNLLNNKLKQIITKNGIADNSHNPRFFLAPIISVLTKEITPTAPPMNVLQLEISFYVGDAKTRSIFSETSITVKGAGKSEDKAYIAAFKNIKVKSAQFKDLIDNGKSQIIEYYNTHCDIILKDAETFASQKKYFKAIHILTTIPSVCIDCYFKAKDKSTDVFNEYVDNKCAEDMTKARAAWASFNENEALNYLSQIFPDTKCYEDAQKLVEEIMNHGCSKSLGSAKAAWANRDSDNASKYLAEIPAFSQCGKDADILAKEIKKTLDAQAYASWQAKKIKDERDYNFQYAQWLAETDLQNKNIEAGFEYKVPVAKSFNMEEEKVQETRELSLDFSKTLTNMLDDLSWLFQ